MDQSLVSEAVSAARVALIEGRAEDAIPALQAHIDRMPADHEARYVLASICIALGDPALGETVLNEARTLHALALARSMGADLVQCRSDPVHAAQVATTLYARHLVAISSAVRAIELSGGEAKPESLISYGLALQHQGRVEEACDAFRAAAETFPGPAVHQFLLFPQLFRDDGAARYAAEARAWAQAHTVASARPSHANPELSGRKLRIGYVAPSFSTTQLRQFIAPLLENHDPGRVSVTLYVRDAAAETNWPAWIKVRTIGDLADADAAALIQQDRIDVLADCWGHTAGSRLPVFAHRPAPVQVAWINFVQTTGLPQVDYVLHASSQNPPDLDGQFVEKIWPIGPVFTVFSPSPDRLPPTETPALSTGRVTFGSFNHPAKLSADTVAVWAAVLRYTPGSRLLLKYSYFADPVLQRATQARFAAHGVAAERIAFSGLSRGAEYFEAFAQVDLALDPWPAPGSTTTLEALSNGVPVLALDGPEPTLGGAYSRSMIEASGLTELVATSREDFLRRAVELTADLDALNALRARVRPGFESGGCCDGIGFTRRVEVAFGEMFDVWRGQAESRRRAT
jgi:predicted O-linked N-acetylglucosamine transferase (SPINDLY family)